MTDVDKKAKKPTKAAQSSRTREEATAAETQGRRRPVRITRDLLVNQGPLNIPASVKRPGYRYFWMKDEKYRFEEFERLGYDFVTDARGNKVTAGKGSTRMMLLDIPEDLHKEILEVNHEIKQEKTQERRGLKNPKGVSNSSGIYEDQLIVK